MISACTPQEARARDLLRQHLTEAEWEHYWRTGGVWATGSLGGRYLIVNTGGVYREQGRRCASLCVYFPRMTMPPSDVVLANLLAIRYDEGRFRATANVTGEFGREALDAFRDPAAPLTRPAPPVVAIPRTPSWRWFGLALLVQVLGAALNWVFGVKVAEPIGALGLVAWNAYLAGLHWRLARRAPLVGPGLARSHRWVAVASAGGALLILSINAMLAATFLGLLR